MGHKMISSWPGPDPAIHVYHRPTPSESRLRPTEGRVKPGDDDSRATVSAGIETSPLNLRVSVVNILDAPHGGGA